MPFVILFLVLLIVFLLVFRAAVWTVVRGLLTVIDALVPGAAIRIVRLFGTAWGIVKFLIAAGFLIIIAAIFCGR
jgi:hypothetical protein